MASAWPSVTLATALVLYPTTLHLLSKFSQGPASLKTFRDGVSSVHCSIITISSLSALIEKGFITLPLATCSPRDRSTCTSLGKDINYMTKSTHPMLLAKSTFANSITALETGYLVQDTFLLLYQYWKGRKINMRVLILHHITLGTTLSWLQTRIWMKKEKGVYIVVMFMLMNAS